MEYVHLSSCGCRSRRPVQSQAGKHSCAATSATEDMSLSGATRVAVVWQWTADGFPLNGWRAFKASYATSPFLLR